MTCDVLRVLQPGDVVDAVIARDPTGKSADGLFANIDRLGGAQLSRIGANDYIPIIASVRPDVNDKILSFANDPRVAACAAQLAEDSEAFRKLPNRRMRRAFENDGYGTIRPIVDAVLSGDIAALRLLARGPGRRGFLASRALFMVRGAGPAAEIVRVVRQSERDWQSALTLSSTAEARKPHGSARRCRDVLPRPAASPHACHAPPRARACVLAGCV